MNNFNLHIYPSDMLLESRIFKESRFILKNMDFERAVLLGVWEKGLKKEEELEKNIIIKRVKLFNVKKRSILYIYSIFYSFCYVLYHRPRMINIHTLEFLPLCLITKLFNLTVIYDTHELETEKCFLGGIRKKISKKIERLFIKKVDLIFVVSQNIAKWYENEYKIPRPGVILNAPKLFNQANKNLFRENLNIKTGSKIVLYQGGLSRGRGIEILLEAFKKRATDDFVLVLMGSGPLEKPIIDAAEDANNIFYHKAVNPNVVLEYTSSADFGVSLIENVCLSYYFCMPNKLFEYAMVGLPVIVSDMKEMREMVESYTMGAVVEQFDVDGINNSLDKLLTVDYDNMRNNAIRCARENCWENQEKKMLEAYESLNI